MSLWDDYKAEQYYEENKSLERMERKLIMDNLTNVTTGEVRFSFVHLFKPYAFTPVQEEKFSCTILVPKSDLDTKARIDAAINAAIDKGVSDKWNGSRPPVMPIPVYDGDGVRPSDGMAFGPECRGHWVFTASAKADYPPEVVDERGNPIINQSQVYSGMYGKVNVTFFPYAFGGKKGIGCGLGPVMKTKDGESLGGSAPTAAQVFGAPQTQAQPNPYVNGQQAAPQIQPNAHTASRQAINPVTGLPM